MTVDIEKGRKLQLDCNAEHHRVMRAISEGVRVDMNHHPSMQWAEWLRNNADALLAELEALRAVAAAAVRRLRYGHNDTCSHELICEPPEPCDCGQDELDAALARHKEVSGG